MLTPAQLATRLRLGTNRKMKFVKISSIDEVVGYLVELISAKLSADKAVLWLVSGGSAIKIEKEVASRLSAAARLNNLTVLLADERYGPPGHPDSNWEQLKQAGFLLPGAQFMPILSDKSIEETTAQFSYILKRSLLEHDYKVGLFGMGVDGHTAGILPASPAVSSPELAVHYDGGEYQRITCTAAAITNLDEAILYAVGAEKSIMLDKLSSKVGINEQPAQVLKKVPKLTIFNDQRGKL